MLGKYRFNPTGDHGGGLLASAVAEAGKKEPKGYLVVPRQGFGFDFVKDGTGDPVCDGNGDVCHHDHEPGRRPQARTSTH